MLFHKILTNHVYETSSNVQDKTAAEILLSVGGGGQTIGVPAEVIPPKIVPSTVKLDEGTNGQVESRKIHVDFICDCDVIILQASTNSEKGWTSLEVVDAEGQPKRFLVKTLRQSDGSIDGDKLVQVTTSYCGKNLPRVRPRAALIVRYVQFHNCSVSTLQILNGQVEVVGNPTIDPTFTFTDGCHLMTTQDLELPTIGAEQPITTLEISMENNVGEYVLSYTH